MRPEAVGLRDRRVVVQQMTEGIAPSGAPIETWTTLTTVWAHKFDPPLFFAREKFIANQEVASYDTEWTLPYMPAMDPELVNVPKYRRLLIKGRVHDIIAASEVGRREGIKVFTTAGGLLDEGA